LTRAKPPNYLLIINLIEFTVVDAILVDINSFTRNITTWQKTSALSIYVHKFVMRLKK